MKDQEEEQDQTPAPGGVPQELSCGQVVDEELPLGQVQVERLLVVCVAVIT